MLTDIEIAKNIKLKDIKDIASSAGILEEELETYGKYKAKINDSIYKRLEKKDNGKLILVTAVNPTPAGEGKTTVSIGLSQALNLLGRKSVLSLREPSLGPVFGIKGGATGGGYSQIAPMCDINLHFTGDIHAMTSANNLMCAVLDNHIYQGNELNIDPEKILVKRCLDMNDRSLRNIRIGIGGGTNGVERQDSFMITVATEIMAIICLAENIDDLRERLCNILVAYTKNDRPIFLKDLKIVGSLLALLKDAIKPNLVQTLEGTPAVVHGGPFANIAHGCSSVRATKLALKISDYCVTEAGFGADLGAEKFFNIKCRKANLLPDAVVLTVTVRALKYNGGVSNLEDLKLENLDALKKGICNLERHIKNLKLFNIPLIVAINRFFSDTESELDFISDFCKKSGVESAVVNVHTQGGNGGIDLAEKVCDLCEKSDLYKGEIPSNFYSEESLKENTINEINFGSNNFNEDKIGTDEKDFIYKNTFEKINNFQESKDAPCSNKKSTTFGTKRKNNFSFLYNLDLSIEEKIETVAKNIYGADGVVYEKKALDALKKIKDLSGTSTLPVCIAKTQYSFSDNKDLLGAPKNFKMTVRNLKPCLGAGFIVVYMGNIVTMPGLSKSPCAEIIDLDQSGEICGLS